MSPLEFFDVGKASMILASLLCLPVLFFHSFLGKFLLKEEGAFTRALASVSLCAALTTILLAVASVLAKGFIYAAWGLGAFLAGRQAWRTLKGFSPEGGAKKADALQSLALWLGFALLQSILLLIYLADLDQGGPGKLLFNGHQNYFSGIPLEIFHADYFGRIRIFDNYPVVWSKYHFFTGSLIAQTLGILPEKNYPAFMAAKISIVTLMLLAVIENGRRIAPPFKIAVLTAVSLLYLFTALANHVYWGLTTNSFSSIVYLILGLGFIWEKRLYAAVFFLLCFSLSTSRSLLPGACLLAALLFRHGLQDFGSSALREIRGILGQNRSARPAFTVFLFALLSMVLLGKSPETPGHFSARNFLNEDWLSLMSPSLTAADKAARLSPEAIVKPDPLWYAFWLALMLSGLWLWARRKPSSFEKPAFPTTSVATVTLAVAIIVWALPQGKILLFYFALPVFLAIALAPGALRKYIVVFSGISLLQVLLLKGEISFPNFAIMECVIWFCFLGRLLRQNPFPPVLSGSFLIAAAILLATRGLPLRPNDLFKLTRLDTSTHEINLAASARQVTPPDRTSLFRYAGDDETAALAAFLGRRVTYSEKKSDRYSMSKTFALPSDADLRWIDALPPEK